MAYSHNGELIVENLEDFEWGLGSYLTPLT